jgi:hypothetical protein
MFGAYCSRRAFRWYEKERAGLGSEFLEAVDGLLRVIAENPERFPLAHKDVRRAANVILKSGGYVINRHDRELLK